MVIISQIFRNRLVQYAVDQKYVVKFVTFPGMKERQE